MVDSSTILKFFFSGYKETGLGFLSVILLVLFFVCAIFWLLLLFRFFCACVCFVFYVLVCGLCLFELKLIQTFESLFVFVQIL